MRKRIIILSALVLCFTVWFGQFAQATSVSFDLDFEFSGGFNPSGPAPWLNILIEDAGADTVNVTFTSHLSTSGEFISEIYMNLDPLLDETMLSGAVTVGNPAWDSLQVWTDHFKADGDGRYDLLFSYDHSGPGQFTVGSTTTTTLSLSGLDAYSFSFLSQPAGGNGPFYAAAHVQGIGEECSGWIGSGDSSLGTAGDVCTPVTVPEPATSVLLLSGLVMVGLAAKWKRTREKRRSSRL